MSPQMEGQEEGEGGRLGGVSERNISGERRQPDEALLMSSSRLRAGAEKERRGGKQGSRGGKEQQCASVTPSFQSRLNWFVMFFLMRAEKGGK